MDRYFALEITGNPFRVFSPSHLLTLFAIAIANVILVFWLKKTKDQPSLRRFSLSLAAVLLFNELFYIFWGIITGDWSMDHSLPIQLCEATAVLSAIMLVRNEYRIFEIVYFWGIGGATQALLTPDLYYPFPHCRFFNFFLSHGAILTAIIYMVVVKQYKPTFKSLIKTYIFTNIYMLLVALANLLTGGNYMFLCSKPENGSLLDILGPWPWYILSLEAVGFLVFLLCYLPFAIIDSRQRASIHKQPNGALWHRKNS